MRSLTKKILLLLAAVGDEVADWEKTVSSPYLRVKFASYKDNYFLRNVQQMIKAGEIERVIKKGEPVLRITSQGEIKLIYTIPLAKRIGKSWDGKWRMVIFDVPEISKNKRDGLRRKLKDLGFAQWQESVYIAPFDIASELAEYLQANGLADNAIALEAKKIFIGDERQMAAKLWHLENLSLKYQEFVKKYRERKDKRGMQEDYLSILEEDPYLPRELLPEPWWGMEARKLLGRI